MPDTAFLFPGQGAQHVGMGSEAYAGSTAARDVFDSADRVLGTRLSKIILEGPAEELTRSHNAQPAILTVSIACLRAMEERLGSSMPKARFVAGHSLGEYSALVAAGSLSLDAALELVRRRGELMQAAAEATPSGMAAVLGMELAVLEGVCAETGAQIANVNSAAQIVIGGPTDALQRAIDLALERGARRAIPLDVAGAFHTEVMRPAQAALVDALGALDIGAAGVPVIANASARELSSAEEVRGELDSQTCSPVLWQQSMELMASRGVERFIEIGPGNVLSALAKRIVPRAESRSIADLDAIGALA